MPASFRLLPWMLAIALLPATSSIAAEDILPFKNGVQNQSGWAPYTSAFGDGTLVLCTNTEAEGDTTGNTERAVVAFFNPDDSVVEEDGFFDDFGTPWTVNNDISRTDGNPPRIAGDKRPGKTRYLLGNECTPWAYGNLFPSYGSGFSYQVQTGSVQMLEKTPGGPTPLTNVYDPIFGQWTTGDSGGLQVGRFGGEIRSLSDGNFVVVQEDRTGNLVSRNRAAITTIIDGQGGSRTFGQVIVGPFNANQQSPEMGLSIWSNVAAYDGGFATRPWTNPGFIDFWNNDGSPRGTILLNVRTDPATPLPPAGGFNTSISSLSNNAESRIDSDIHSDFVYFAGRGIDAEESSEGGVYVTKIDANSLETVQEAFVSEGLSVLPERVEVCSDRDDNVFVCWSDKSNTGNRQVLGRFYDNDLNPVSSVFLVFRKSEPGPDVITGFSAKHPSCSMVDGRALVTARVDGPAPALGLETNDHIATVLEVPGYLSPTPSPSPTPTPLPRIVRNPADGGPPVSYSSLREAVLETTEGDELFMTGTEEVNAPIALSVPQVSLEASGSAMLLEGETFPSSHPLIRIEKAAAGTRIFGFRFVGAGLHGEEGSACGPEPIESTEAWGAGAVYNYAPGVELENCLFTGFGSGAFCVGATVSNRGDDGSSTLRVNSCRFDTNHTSLWATHGTVQVHDTEFVDSSYGDFVMWDLERQEYAAGQVLDCTFSSWNRPPPLFRIFAASSPSNLEVVGCRIGPSQRSNVIFGDGSMLFAWNVVFNGANVNHSVLSLGTMRGENYAGIPTDVTVDHCDLYNHGSRRDAWIFEEGRGALITAGEIADRNGDTSGPCRVKVTNSILSGSVVPDGTGDTGIAFRTLDDEFSVDNRLEVTNSVICMLGANSLESAFRAEDPNVDSLHFGDTHYANVGPLLDETEFEFHYSRNALAAFLGTDAGPVGAMGPDDSLEVAVFAPRGLEFNLREGVLEVPVLIDNASGVAAVDVVIGFDSEVFEAVSLVPGDILEGGQIASNLQPGQVQASMLLFPVSSVNGERVLLRLFLFPKAEVVLSPIEILNVQATAGDYSTIGVRVSDGDISISLEYIAGDADLSGQVDIMDVVVCLNHLVGLEGLSPAGVEAADLVDPGMPGSPDFDPVDPLSIDDALAIFEIVLGVWDEE